MARRTASTAPWAGVVVAEVEDRLHAALPDLLGQPGAGGSLMEEAAARLPGQLGERVRSQVSTAEFLLRPDAEELVERFLAAMCECYGTNGPPPDLSPRIARALANVEADLAHTEERIRTFALGQYHAALSELRQDVSIFAGTTLALFLAALGLGVFKGRASAHLLPVSLVLTGDPDHRRLVPVRAGLGHDGGHEQLLGHDLPRFFGRRSDFPARHRALPRPCDHVPAQRDHRHPGGSLLGHVFGAEVTISAELGRVLAAGRPLQRRAT